MAETGFNLASVTAVPAADRRTDISQRASAEASRVQPVAEQAESADLRNDREERTSDVADTVANIDRLAQGAFKNSRLKITRDQESKDFIYLMIDQDTGEAVRRWPPETHTELLEYLRTRTAGILDQRA